MKTIYKIWGHDKNFKTPYIDEDEDIWIDKHWYLSDKDSLYHVAARENDNDDEQIASPEETRYYYTFKKLANL